jgi:predicted acyltransferase
MKRDTPLEVEKGPLARGPRLVSLDALRGFDMFLLLGAQQLVGGLLDGAPAGTWQHVVREQFEHVAWEGFRLYDAIFPVFLFLIGVSVPISVAGRLERGETRAAVLRHAAQRWGLMTLLGFITTGNLLSWRVEEMRLSYSVLMMLGWGGFFSTVLVLYTRPLTQKAVTVGIFAGYWLIQKFVPYPGKPLGPFEDDLLFGSWLYDVTLAHLPKPWASPYGRGIPLWGWTMAANAMLGVFAGQFLMGRGWAGSRGTPVRPATRELALSGVAALILAWVWSWHLPIVKDAWTSSFVFLACGWGCLALALFHWICDVRGWIGWAWLFRVIGANSILAYLLAWPLNAPFDALADRLVGELSPVWPRAAFVVLHWLIKFGSIYALLAWMHRQRIFLRL